MKPYMRRAFGEPAPVEEPRPMSASVSVLSQIMLPNDANPLGNVHGGSIMKLVDMSAAVSAMRHCHRQVVTVAIEQMSFHEPAYIGDLVTITSRVEYVGRTSMLVRSEVEAENPTSGKKVHTGSSILTFVALGPENRPVPVPPLYAETDEEKALMEEGKRQYEFGKAQRARMSMNKQVLSGPARQDGR